MDPVVIGVVVSSIVLAASSVFGVWLTDKRRAHLRRLSKVPRTTIAAARDGEVVRIVGRVAAADAPFRSWLGDQAVVWHACEVRRNEQARRALLSEHFERATFVVIDDSGALVLARTSPAHFIIETGPPELRTEPERDAHDARLAALLPRDAEGRHIVIVGEKWIAVGSTIAIVGRAKLVRDLAIGLYRGSAPRLELTGTEVEPVIVCDAEAVLR